MNEFKKVTLKRQNDVFAFDVQDQMFIYDIFYGHVRSSFTIERHSASCHGGPVATCVDSVYPFLTHEIFVVDGLSSLVTTRALMRWLTVARLGRRESLVELWSVRCEARWTYLSYRGKLVPVHLFARQTRLSNHLEFLARVSSTRKSVTPGLPREELSRRSCRRRHVRRSTRFTIFLLLRRNCSASTPIPLHITSKQKSRTNYRTGK